MRPWLILLSGLIAATAHAGENDDLYENQCHDQAGWNKIDDLLRKVPNDPIVIRTYAMRLGICRLIEEKKITLETGIQVFDVERQRALMERSMEDAERRKRKKPLLIDDLEPVS